MNFDAVIVGGGPAGASAAIALRQAGLTVAVIERAEFPRRKVCGEFLSAPSLSELDALGVGANFAAAAGPPVRRVAVFAGEAMCVAPMPRGRYGRALGRDALDTLLLARARDAGATVFQPWRADAVMHADGLAHVRIASGDGEMILTAPVVIAAHGSWESGPLPSHLPKRRRPSDLFGFKAHFRDAALAPDTMPLLAFPGGYGGMVWADRGRVSLSCCIRRDALAQARARHGGASAAESVFLHIAETCRGAREALAPARADGPFLAAGPIRPGIRPAYANGIFRIGNAAGESHPVIAEGISMAIQSARMLARELARAGVATEAERAAAGRRYARAWRLRFGPRLAASAAFAHLAMNPLAARLAMPVLEAAPALVTLGAGLSGKAAPEQGAR